MDYHFEKEIRLKESEDKVLYPWSLQEYGCDGGAPTGGELIPWQWTLYFTASELRYYKSIDIEKSDTFADGLEKEEKVKDSDCIIATIHPGICDDGNWLKNDTVFSMFGTDRKIKNFILRISKLDAGDAVEFCRVWGCVKHTIKDIDGDETIDDTVQGDMYISLQRFNSIADIVKNQVSDVAQVRLGKVNGFYSEWSPSIYTEGIKILTANDHKIISDGDCDIVPPRLGKVGEFNLTITLRRKLNPKQDLRSIDIYKLFMDYEFEDDEEARKEISTKSEPDTNASFVQPDYNAPLLSQLVRNEIAISKLRIPLWLILCLLLLLFIQQML